MKPPKGWGGVPLYLVPNTNGDHQESSSSKQIHCNNDALFRFLLNPQTAFSDPPDAQDCRAARDFLLTLVMDVRAGRDLKKRFSKIGIRKKRDNRFDPAAVSVFSEEFSFALAVETKKMSEGVAVSNIASLHEVTIRHARTWLNSLRAEARLYMRYISLLRRPRKIRSISKNKRIFDGSLKDYQEAWDAQNQNEYLNAIEFLRSRLREKPASR